MIACPPADLPDSQAGVRRACAFLVPLFGIPAVGGILKSGTPAVLEAGPFGGAVAMKEVFVFISGNYRALRASTEIRVTPRCVPAIVCAPEGQYEERHRYRMTKKRFTLVARVSTDNRQAMKQVLEKLVAKRSITSTDEGFLVKAAMYGESARELNRSLLSVLRRVERTTRQKMKHGGPAFACAAAGKQARLRSEWKSGGITERFFHYVPKGSRKA